MLVQFSIENFRSFKELQTFSFAASKAKEHRESHVFSTNTAGTPELLRSAILYGPNASGKSNLVKSLATMKEIVIRSAKLQQGDKLPISPFLFSGETREAPSAFEAVFIAEGIRYQYGFKATETRIEEEWLNATPKGRTQKILHRILKPGTNEYEWSLGEKLQGQKTLWQQATRPNALFLSTAVQLNSRQLLPVYDWFRKRLRILESFPLAEMSQVTASMCIPDINDESSGISRDDVLNFLREADFDIADFEVERRKLNKERFFATLPKKVADVIISEYGDEFDKAEHINIQMLHNSSNGDRIPLNWEDESSGTQKFFALAGPWMIALSTDCLLVIDELNDKLHPLLVQYLLRQFHSINESRAQLLCTTHETSILNQELLRRDQIWFCERESAKGAMLYPLSDFSPLKDREDLEQSYLHGRYGALPYFTQLNLIMETGNEKKRGK